MRGTAMIPALGFYTHVSDQHDPYSVCVMSAISHEAPYVLDGLLHRGTALQIDTHYTDTGGAHVFILCAMLGIRFCPRLRDFPIASSPALNRAQSTQPSSRCSGGASAPTSSARIGTCCAWSRH